MRNILFANRNSRVNFALDGPYHNAEDILELEQLVRGWGYSFGSVLLTCDNKVLWDQRLHERALKTSNPYHKVASLQELEASVGGFSVSHVPGELSLDMAVERSEIGVRAMQ
jgi:hypothetical protein